MRFHFNDFNVSDLTAIKLISEIQLPSLRFDWLLAGHLKFQAILLAATLSRLSFTKL